MKRLIYLLSLVLLLGVLFTPAVAQDAQATVIELWEVYVFDFSQDPPYEVEMEMSVVIGSCVEVLVAGDTFNLSITIEDASSRESQMFGSEKPWVRGFLSKLAMSQQQSITITDLSGVGSRFTLWTRVFQADMCMGHSDPVMTPLEVGVYEVGNPFTPTVYNISLERGQSVGISLVASARAAEVIIHDARNGAHYASSGLIQANGQDPMVASFNYDVPETMNYYIEVTIMQGFGEYTVAVSENFREEVEPQILFPSDNQPLGLPTLIIGILPPDTVSYQLFRHMQLGDMFQHWVPIGPVRTEPLDPDQGILEIWDVRQERAGNLYNLRLELTRSNGTTDSVEVENIPIRDPRDYESVPQTLSEAEAWYSAALHEFELASINAEDELEHLAETAPTVEEANVHLHIDALLSSIFRENMAIEAFHIYEQSVVLFETSQAAGGTIASIVRFRSAVEELLLRANWVLYLEYTQPEPEARTPVLQALYTETQPRQAWNEPATAVYQTRDTQFLFEFEALSDVFYSIGVEVPGGHGFEMFIYNENDELIEHVTQRHLTDMGFYVYLSDTFVPTSTGGYEDFVYSVLVVPLDSGGPGGYMDQSFSIHLFNHGGTLSGTGPRDFPPYIFANTKGG